MEQEPRPITHDDLHATYVERSIRELQRVVQEEEGVLAELRRSTAVAAPVASAAASLAIMTTAYEAAARADPFLPFPDSVLPALLALRKTHQILAESQTFLEGSLSSLSSPTSSTLDKARRQLVMDKARLGDQVALQVALETRIAALRSGLETRSTMTFVQRRQEALDALHRKRRDYDRDTAVLLKALKQFIQEQLGPMLAAEELGGPVVGGMVDVQTDDLAAGFSAQGKPRSRPGAEKTAKKDKDDDRRQRRIDEIWGPRRSSGGDDNEEGEEGDDDDANERSRKEGGRGGSSNNWDEAAAASAEMQELTEELLNALVGAGDGASAYVTIARESAAARFLVRSQVAQFHPRDATRLRLIDFGRELDD